jgi:hypothetical protein
MAPSGNSFKENIMKRILVAGAGIAFVLTSAQPAAHAQFARQEIHAFQSSNTTGPEFLSGKKGTPVTLAGHLRMPKLAGKQGLPPPNPSPQCLQIFSCNAFSRRLS